MLKNKNHKYFYFFRGNQFEENKNILILKKGNIAFFMKQGNSEESNVILKSLVKENDLLTFLYIAKKIIRKNKFIISDKILSKFNILIKVSL